MSTDLQVMHTSPEPYVDRQESSSHSKSVEKTATGQRENEASEKSSQETKYSVTKTPNSSSMKTSHHSSYKSMSESSETSGQGFPCVSTPKAMISFRSNEDSKDEHKCQSTIPQQSPLKGAHQVDESSSLEDQIVDTTQKSVKEARNMHEERKHAEHMTKKHITSENLVPIEMEPVSSKLAPLVSTQTQENFSQRSESQRLCKSVPSSAVVTSSSQTNQSLHNSSNVLQSVEQTSNERKHVVGAVPQVSSEPYVDHQQTSSYSKTVEKTATGQRETEESKKSSQDVQHSVQTAPNSASMKKIHHSSYETMSQSALTSKSGFRPEDSPIPVSVETTKDVNTRVNQHGEQNNTSIANQLSSLDQQIVQTAQKSGKEAREILHEKTQTVDKKNITSENVIPIEMEPVLSKPAPARFVSTQDKHSHSLESHHSSQDVACSPNITYLPEIKHIAQKDANQYLQKTIDEKNGQIDTVSEISPKPYVDRQQTSTHCKTVEKTATGQRETEESEKSNRNIQHSVQRTPNSTSMNMSQHSSYQTMSQSTETSSRGFRPDNTRTEIFSEPFDNLNACKIQKERKHQTNIADKQSSLDEQIVETSPKSVKERREVFKEKSDSQDVVKNCVTSEKIVPIKLAPVLDKPSLAKSTMTENKYNQSFEMQQVLKDTPCSPIITSPLASRQTSQDISEVVSHVSESSDTYKSNERTIPVTSFSEKQPVLKSSPKSQVSHPFSGSLNDTREVKLSDCYQSQQRLEDQIQDFQKTTTKEAAKPVSSTAGRKMEMTSQESSFAKSVSSGEEHMIPITMPGAPILSHIAPAPVGPVANIPCIDRQETSSHSKDHQVSGNTVTETESSEKSAYSVYRSGPISVPSQDRQATVLDSAETHKTASETKTSTKNKSAEASNRWNPAPINCPVSRQTERATQQSSSKHSAEQTTNQQTVSNRSLATSMEDSNLQTQAGTDQLTTLGNIQSHCQPKRQDHKSFAEEWEKDDKSDRYQSMSYSSGGNVEIFDKDGRRVRKETQESEEKKTQKKSEKFDTEEIRQDGKKCRVHKTVKTTTEQEITQSSETESSMS